MSDYRWNAATRPAVPGDHVVGICKGGHDSTETPCEYQPITEADVLELVKAVAAAQAEAREATKQHQRLAARYEEIHRQLNEWRTEALELRAQMEQVRRITLGMNEYVDSCSRPSEMSKGNAVGYWHAQLVTALSQPAAEQPAPETFVGVTESGHYSYHDCAKSSRHGWMQCTACRSPITSGEYRTREHADRYATWHRDCCPDDPHWRERDAMSQTAAERIEDYNERGQEGRE